MPKNYSALVRYLVINRLLASGRRVTKTEIIDAIEEKLDKRFGGRTIDSDINRMRYDRGLGFYAPIRIDRRTGEYYYGREDFTIESRSLADEEIISLVFAAQFLKQFENVELIKTFHETVQKLVDTDIIQMLEGESDLKDKIEFDYIPDAQGMEHFETIVEALKYEFVLKIAYQSFYADRTNTHIIHPYMLKEYHNRWYLVGYNDKFGGIRTYALDRIKSLERESSVEFRDVEFDAANYFRHTVGITTSGNEPAEIVVSLTDEQAQYVLSQPIHESQEVVSEMDGSVEIKFNLIPTFEFKSQLLGWGDQVEVLSPDWFREEIRDDLRRTLGRY
jgi:predicted DNA-binding transcriptional regulator YafY